MPSFCARKKHEDVCNNHSTQFTCPVCNKKFASASALISHENESGHNQPGTSGSTSNSNDPVKEAEERAQGTEKNKKVKCSTCKAVLPNRKALYDHRMTFHKQSDNSLQPVPWNDEPIWKDKEGNIDYSLKKTYEQHKHLILRPNISNKGKIKTVYNFPLSEDFTLEDLMRHIESIYEESNFSFKINLSFGIILRHVSTGEFRYFVPYYNQNIFNLPILINNRDDLRNLREKLSEMDVKSYMLRQRENTSWKPWCITNVNIEIYKTSFPLGHLAKPLPSYIKNSKSIVSFEINPRTKRPYNDFLCFYRCLAFHKKRSIYIESACKELFSTWLQYVKKNLLKSSDVTLKSIPDLEKCFNVNIHIYSLAESGAATSLYKSRECIVNADKKKDIMYLNMYDNHLCYIVNFTAYCKKFQCKVCSKLFTSNYKCAVHERKCKAKTKIKFPGGYYSLPKTMFEKLDEYGISVNRNDRHYPWFITYDFESLLVKDKEISHLKWHTTHKPVSVSVCSNVEGFEDAEFFLDDDLDSLLSQMINYMNKISEKAFRLSKSKWNYVSDHLDKLDMHWGVNESNSCSDSESIVDNDFCDGDQAMESNEYDPPSNKFLNAIKKENVYYSFLNRLQETERVEAIYNDWNSVDPENSRDTRSDEQVVTDDSGTSDDEYFIEPFSPLNSTSCAEEIICNDNDDFPNKNRSHGNLQMLKNLKELRKDFEAFCQQIPVLGYNSAKYDLNLIKEKLAKHLGMHLKNNGKKFVIKKNNAYMCIANSSLRFLDMLAYLPPNTSYDKFLQTFKVKTRKSFFPYEYFTNIDVLKETKLPPKEAFYSHLKQKNVLENDLFITYTSLRKSGKTKLQAFAVLNLKPDDCEPTSTIESNYKNLEHLWETENFSSMTDYLRYYNNLDAYPFVQGVAAFKEFFTKNNIDVFKDCISIPGVARKMLFENGFKNGANFSLIDAADEDLYHKLKNSLVGGPSVIFSRFHKADETYIRENKMHICKSVLGLDFNSLYLHSIMQPMCVNNYIRRKKEFNFRPIVRKRKYTSMFDWMDWLSLSRNITINHKQNYGKELRIGAYLIDGFESGSKNLFEFLGCWFHGHDCKYVIGKQTEKQRSKRYQKHESKMKFLNAQGYNVECIWECQYHSEKQNNKAMQAFVENRRLPFHKKFPREVTKKQILENVVNETFFGFLEVSLKVSDTWEESMFKPSTNLTPYEYFAEMSPIFCTTDIPFDCIGEHMQDFVKLNNLRQKPRTLLVGGMSAEKILLASPLLKWYIEHGLIITDVFEIIEFGKMACFQEFGEQITAARRMGDMDPSLEIIAMLHKLIGNSGYGGTLIDQLKFLKIKYIKGFKEACHKVNDVRFKKLTELQDDLFEAELNHSAITVNTPIQIGNMILQYSKLRLLQFYYDWLDIYIDRKSFELVETDTDSLYFALSGESLEDVIKPELRQSYLQTVSGSLVCNDNFSGDEKTWFPRKCCQKHSKHDNRTPGLMKVEFHGNEIVALCSKTYAASSNNCIKYSMKGVNKTFVDPLPLYKSVLNTLTNITSINRGFKVMENKIRTYEQRKTALNYFYCKRRVLSCGIRTVPLDITLSPIQRDISNDVS